MPTSGPPSSRSSSTPWSSTTASSRLHGQGRGARAPAPRGARQAHAVRGRAAAGAPAPARHPDPGRGLGRRATRRRCMPSWLQGRPRGRWRRCSVAPRRGRWRGGADATSRCGGAATARRPLSRTDTLSITDRHGPVLRPQPTGNENAGPEQSGPARASVPRCVLDPGKPVLVLQWVGPLVGRIRADKSRRDKR